MKLRLGLCSVLLLAFNVAAIDLCSEKMTNKDHVLKGMRLCRDGSTSFIQPKSTGIKGYEGKCGQTAAANLTYYYCKMALSPVVDINDFFSDSGPGVNSSTLKDGLNDIFQSARHVCPDSQEWTNYTYKTAEQYLLGIENGLKANIAHKHKLRRWRKDGSLVFTTPVAALIAVANSRSLHWITIVDVIRDEKNCTVVLNEFGKQGEISCDYLKQISLRAALLWSPFVSPFTLVKYKSL